MKLPAHLLILLFFCLLDSGTPQAVADDWPQFRGTKGQGHSAAADLPLDWSTTKNVAWKRPIPGNGWSSPIVHDGKIYLTTAVAATDKPDSNRALMAVCLDAKSGKQLWAKKVFHQDGATAPKIHSKNSHASPTPLIADRLYVHFGHQGTACLDLDGKVVWQKKSKYAPVHGGGPSPILSGELLIFGYDGSDKQMLTALERSSGKTVWKTPRESTAKKKFSFCTPLLIKAGDRAQIISSFSDSVCSYDPATGKEIWRVRYTGYSVVPRPVFGHGLVFISTSFDAPEVLAIRPDGSGDVTDSHVAWRLKKGAPHTPSLLLVGDELYMVSDRGIATCVDARSGKVHWQKRIGGNFSASPMHADGRIYLQNEAGMGVVIAVGKQFKELARNDLAERTLASYAASDGALFIRTETQLYRIGR